MKLNEVVHWREFIADDGTVFDLSFLDGKKVTYKHSAKGKADVFYEFYVTYSFHCFTKDYPELSDNDRSILAYNAPKETRPFCIVRYDYAKKYLCDIIENLGTPEYIITDAGYSNYITAKLITESGNIIWYKVPFKVFRENKKYRLHVLSAYPTNERPAGGKIGFFVIAYNLRTGKPLPRNSHK